VAWGLYFVMPGPSLCRRTAEHGVVGSGAAAPRSEHRSESPSAERTGIAKWRDPDDVKTHPTVCSDNVTRLLQYRS